MDYGINYRDQNISNKPYQAAISNSIFYYYSIFFNYRWQQNSCELSLAVQSNDWYGSLYVAQSALAEVRIVSTRNLLYVFKKKYRHISFD